MYLSSLTDRGATPALVKMLSFNEAKLGVIAENVANFGTPGYRTKQLDTRGFQGALREALDVRGRDYGRPLVVNHAGQVETREDGSLRVTPGLAPAENVLFHDGTNMSLERQMTELAKTGMQHEFMTTLLRGNYDGMRKAIRGTV